MSDILKEIERTKKDEIKEAKQKVPEREVRQKAEEASTTRGFIEAIKSKHAADKFALIAEIKKASPSKGVIREDFVPSSLAKAYENGGAACLSVLTDRQYFQGAAEYLIAAREVTSLPVLRKDFLFEPYQVMESRGMGADCILVIIASLTRSIAYELIDCARVFNMDALIEVHDEKELEIALDLTSSIKSSSETCMIGINNRNLRNFEVDLAVCERLAKYIPENIIKVAESGIFSHQDCLRLQQSQISTFLVGESLMRENDVRAATEKLLGN